MTYLPLRANIDRRHSWSDRFIVFRGSRISDSTGRRRELGAEPSVFSRADPQGADHDAGLYAGDGDLGRSLMPERGAAARFAAVNGDYPPEGGAESTVRSMVDRR